MVKIVLKHINVIPGFVDTSVTPLPLTFKGLEIVQNA